MSLKTKNAIEKVTGKFTMYSDLINNNIRYEIEVGKDKTLEITLKKKDLTIVKTEMVKRYFDNGNLGGFSARFENPEKRDVTPVTKEYNALCNQVLKIIRGGSDNE